MTRAARFAAACAVVLAVTTQRVGAYNDDPAADQLFPAWCAVLPASPMPEFNTSSICYEIYATGVHRAEAHFRNVSATAVHFDFWAPSFQRPGDNARVSLAPYFATREELKIPLVLRHGRPGLASAQLRVFDLVSGDTDDGTRPGRDAAAANDPPPGDDWMPVVALRDGGALSRSNLMVRLIRDAGRAVVLFRNPSARDLHFRFQVPALGWGPRDAERVHVPAGADTAVLLGTAGSSRPLSLLRVIVSDVRAGEDTGRMLAEDRSADAGWFPLSTSDRSAPLPQDKLLAEIVRAEPGRAHVRFRSRMRTPVRLRFVVPGYQRPDRDNGVVTVAPGEEADVAVELDTPADARLAIARLSVTDVAHRDDE